MIHPDKKTFLKKARRGNLIPVFAEVLADTHTPLTAMAALEPFRHGFLLESVEGAETVGRYSFLGVHPKALFEYRHGTVLVREGARVVHQSKTKTPLKNLKRYMKRFRPVEDSRLPVFCGGAVGYMGYNMVRCFENLPNGRPEDLDMPDAFFMIADTVVVFDHLLHRMQIVVHASTSGNAGRAYDQALRRIADLQAKLSGPSHIPAWSLGRGGKPGRISSSVTQRQFTKMVGAAKEYIRAGDIIQVVLSQRLRCPSTVEPTELYRVLRAINPSPYNYFLRADDASIVGSSPEILVRCEGDRVTVRPIAGTIRRGNDRREDMRLEKRLRQDPKERAEHIMLVDLGRNDIGRVCQKGTVRVRDLMHVERYSHVMHMVTDVTGALRKDKDIYDLLAATFPAGTVTGAPKIRAMQIIDELEPVGRGPYAGALGYVGFSGNLDMAITIRTIVAKKPYAYVQAGAGIVADSKPVKEFHETMAKAEALLQAIEIAKKGKASA